MLLTHQANIQQRNTQPLLLLLLLYLLGVSGPCDSEVINENTVNTTNIDTINNIYKASCLKRSVERALESLMFKAEVV